MSRKKAILIVTILAAILFGALIHIYITGLLILPNKYNWETGSYTFSNPDDQYINISLYSKKAEFTSKEEDIIKDYIGWQISGNDSAGLAIYSKNIKIHKIYFSRTVVIGQKNGKWFAVYRFWISNTY